jgi:hypothetical protein
MTNPDEADSSNILRQYAFHADPLLEESSGWWMARYPHQDWSVSAATKDEALEKLKDEFIRRQNAGKADFTYADTVCLRHLEEPVPGIYAMDNELYRELVREGTAQADMMRAFEEAEVRRQQDQPYTKIDYLQGRERR